ncbi:MAG: hypothetical protein AB7F59_01880 [Bdellovibrionales bacterium]
MIALYLPQLAVGRYFRRFFIVQEFITFSKRIKGPAKRALDFTSWLQLQPEPALPLDCHLKSTLSHHDHHNVEIKNYFEVSQEKFHSEMEVALFVPRSLQATSWRKQDIYGDFRPRLRLSIPMQNRLGHSAQKIALENVAQDLKQTQRSQLNEPFSYVENLQESIKELGAIFSENLKYSGSKSKKHILMSYSLLAPDNLGTTQMFDVIYEMDLYSRHLLTIREWSSQHPLQQLLHFLDDFITQAFIQYLGQMQIALEQGQAQGKGTHFAELHQELISKMKSIQLREVEYSQKKKKMEPNSTPLQGEAYLHHMGQLKKFFQSRMFLDVTRKPSAQKISETMALVGATCAGSWAMLFQKLNRPDLFGVAFQGLFIFCFGVIVYVLRDRIKDWARERLSQRATELIPDFDQQLMTDQENGNDSVGYVKEWFRIQSLQKCSAKDSAEWTQWREAYTPKAILSSVQEDLIVYKKAQEISSTASKTCLGTHSIWAVQENIRINLERFLRHMDDPHKDISILQTDGTLAAYRSHKVYHFYFLVRIKLNAKKKSFLSLSKSAETQPTHSQDKLYRVVMDKLGIQRVEEVLWV